MVNGLTFKCSKSTMEILRDWQLVSNSFNYMSPLWLIFRVPQQWFKAGVSNLSRPMATERECLGGEGHIVNFSLSWGGGAALVIFKILSSKLLLKTTQLISYCILMLCSRYINKTFKMYFPTLIHL